MQVLLQDLQYSLRMLIKRPAFSVMVVLVLALGIGVNTAFFSVVNAVLLRPVPWKDPERIVSVWETNLKRGENRALVSTGNFLDWRDQSNVFEHMAGWRFLYLNLSGSGEAERVQGLTVTADYFPLLGVTAALGRTFMREEEQPGHDKVVVLSHGLWQRRFGSNPNLIGQQITVEGEPRTVIGVLPSEFRIFKVLNRELDIYIPLRVDPAQLARAGMTDEEKTGTRGDAEQILFVYARLKPDISLEQAQAAMDTTYTRLEQQYPKSNTGLGVKLVRLQEQWVEQLRPTLLMLLVSVVFVLLIACANAANLLLARASARKKEMAIRGALGASRFRLIRQLLTESLLMAMISGAAGLLLAFWCIKLLNSLISYAVVNRTEDFRLDGTVLGFTLIISLLTGIVFGLAPALQSSRLNLSATLKEGAAIGSISAGRLRATLVVCEITLTMMLLIGAGLMIRSILSLQGVDRGLNTNSVLTMQIFLPKAKYPGGHQVSDFYRRVLQRVQALPGVESASLINYPPLGVISPTVPFTADGKPLQAPDDAPLAQYALISAEYFQTMGISLLSGRHFTEQDASENNGAVIISNSMAQRFWPNEDPVGRQISPRFPEMRAYWVPESNNLPLTIVGVVGDLNQDGIIGLPEDQVTPPQIYLPYLQNPSSIMHLMVRTASDPLRWAAAVRGEVYDVDKDQPVFDIKSMDEVVAESFARPRILTLLLGTFAALALSLATVGIYGVVSYAVIQRTHEIGIRMALGAQQRDILKLVLAHGMTLAGTGVICGLIAAFAVTRVMSSLLFGVGATDPMTFAGVSVLLTGVALLSSYIPARKAMEVDPMIALRRE